MRPTPTARARRVGDRTRPPRRGSRLLAGAALMLSGCGPATDEAPAEAPAEVAAPAEGVYGRVAPASGGVPSVVTLEGAGPSPGGAPGALEMDQLGLQFNPTRLLVPVGGTVRFRNSESLAHNVTITTADTHEPVFDVDTPPGEVSPFTFEGPGGYDVTCQVHPGMRAFVFVTAAPWSTFADEDGSFAITDVPPGTYVLRVWSVDPARRSERQIEVVAGTATEVTADTSG